MNAKQIDNIKTIVLFMAIIIMIIFALHITYEKYMRDTMLTDGKILCNQIMNAQMSYYSENKKFMTLNKVSYVEEFPLDARNNPYFSVFSTSQSGDKQEITVFGSEEMEGYEIHLEFDNNTNKLRSIKKLKMNVKKTNQKSK